MIGSCQKNRLNQTFVRIKKYNPIQKKSRTIVVEAIERNYGICIKENITLMLSQCFENISLDFKCEQYLVYMQTCPCGCISI